MPESMSLYTNDTLPRPKTATGKHWDDLPWFFNKNNEGRRRWKNRFDTEENFQDKLKNLYRMATEVDAVVGAVVVVGHLLPVQDSDSVVVVVVMSQLEIGKGHVS